MRHHWQERYKNEFGEVIAAARLMDGENVRGESMSHSGGLCSMTVEYLIAGWEVD